MSHAFFSNYTSKAMAGLIDYIRQGKVQENETVVFVHTGGFPSLFAYNAELREAIDEEPIVHK